MRKMKGQKGITLIALIITIIVLLILAVVAVKEVQGEGIIAKARLASEETKKAQAREEVQLALNEWKIENAQTQNGTSLSDFLSSRFGTALTTDGSNYIITLEGQEVKVDANGKIIEEFNAEEWDKLAANEDAFIWKSDDPQSSDYGVVIGYTANAENYTTLRYPSRCTKITFEYDATRYDTLDIATSRAFTNNILKIEIPQTVDSIEDKAFGIETGRNII